MADRRVKVIVEAEVAAYRRGMEQATDATKKLATEAEKVSGSTGKAFDGLRKNADDLQQVGGVLAGTGAALTALAGSAAKSAMDWESAFAGVKKTVDDSAEGYAQLEGELRNLATTLPTTHAEVAAVAEAAGQLGVARDDIVGFTGTMIDLGETTNLTADEAATAIAQISNVMGTMDREGSEGVERFGATLVELGNNGASTESEILDMAQRIAGAAATVGASESDVLALSNTLASMGIRAEQGGGVAQRVILKMSAAADEGGESLEAFARVAGTSAEEFAQKFRESPMEALAMVAGGINGVNEAGGNVTETLAEMGIKGTEETQVMLALANSGDLLTDSLRQGEDAWKSNSALAEEAQKRYETAESQIAIAWNKIKDAAIDAGGAILPVVADVMTIVGDLAAGFADLPDPVQKAVGGLAAVAGVTLTVAGGVGMMIRPIMDTADAVSRLKSNLTRTPEQIGAVGDAAERNKGKLSGFAGALGTLAAAATVGITVGALVPSGEVAEADKLAAALTNIGTGGEEASLGVDQLNAAFTGKGNWFDGLDVGGLDEAFRIMGNPSVADNVDQIASSILTFGTRDSTNMEFARKNFEALDAQLAGMASGGSLDAAKDSFEKVRESAERAGVPTDDLAAKYFPAYAAALEKAEANAAATASSADDLTDSMRDAATQTGDAADSLGALAQVDAESNVGGIAEAMAVLSDESLELEDRLSGVLDALFRMGILEQTAAEAAASFEAALDGVAAAVEENGTTLDITTEAGRKNLDALNGIADAGRGLVTSLAEAGASQGELRDALERTYVQAYNAATAMGATSEEAEILARRAVGLNDMSVDIDTYLSDAALVAAEALGGAIEAIPGYRGVSVVVSDDGTTGTVQESIDEIDGVTRTVFVTTDGTEIEVQAKIENINGVDRTVWVDDQGTIYGTQQDIYAVTGKVVDVEAQATGLGTVESELAYAARTRYATIETAVNYLYGGSRPQQQSVGVLRRAQGGIATLPGYSAGGVLPRTGLGADMILGVTSSGMPIARVDDGEMIVRRSSTDMYRGVLDRINRNDPSVHHLRGYAGGGRAGREWSASAVNPVVNVTAPVGQGITPGELEAAVAAGMSRYRPVFKMGSYEVAGVMREAQDYMGGW